MDEKKKLVERIKKQHKMALNEVKKALEQAKPMVVNIGWGKSPLAVVKLAELIFQINMGAKQQYAQIDKIIAMQRMQEMMQKNKGKQGNCGSGSCGDCKACREGTPK